jgi:cytochrome c oxidase subunit 2
VLQWLPPRISTFAGDIDSIIGLIYYLTAFWFVALHGLLIYMLIRFRRREGRPAVHLTGETLRQSAWILVPALVILVLDLWIDVRGAEAWATVKENQPDADISVQVTGRQFNWEMLYPGPDGRFGTVLHSFFVPDMRLKQDAVPGRTIPVWFQATRPGKYEIGCAELCGFGHATMRGILTVHTPEGWQAWVEKKWPPKRAVRSGAGEPAGNDADEGAGEGS